MTTYKEIFGTNIEVLASDPANPVQGQVWYNSTSNVVKGQGASTVGAWSTGSPLNTARRNMGGAGSSNSSVLAFFGLTPPSTLRTVTESYNGTSWTELNDGNTARQGGAGRGIQDSAIYAGGYDNTTEVTTTETWNGTCWTAVANLNTNKYLLAGAAQNNTAALTFGGYYPPITYLAITESWNGTSWTEVNDLNTARYVLGGSGSSTSALAFGGDGAPAGYEANTESWNGTCWTEVNDINTARIGMGSANGIDNTSALMFAGEEVIPTGGNVIAITEEWNGTCWTEVADMSTAQYSPGGGGITTSALAFGGNSPDPSPVTALTEEWNGAGSPITVTFTDS